MPRGYKPTRDDYRLMAEENAKWPTRLKTVPPVPDMKPRRIMRSRYFLVQEFAEPGGVIRLTVNRTTLNAHGDWMDGITWDELQTIKNESGYANRFAVEAFPEERCVADVANMRHLWVLPERPAWAWIDKPDPV